MQCVAGVNREAWRASAPGALWPAGSQARRLIAVCVWTLDVRVREWSTHSTVDDSTPTQLKVVALCRAWPDICCVFETLSTIRGFHTNYVAPPPDDAPRERPGEKAIPAVPAERSIAISPP